MGNHHLLSGVYIYQYNLSSITYLPTYLLTFPIYFFPLFIFIFILSLQSPPPPFLLKMPLKQLCYILPAADNMGEEAEATAQSQGQHLRPWPWPRRQRERGRLRSCHDQFLSLIRRWLSHLHSHKWSGFCQSCPIKERVAGAAFHDITGVEFSDKGVVGNNSNQPRIFSYAELYIGTHGFSQDQILGSGGFGRVYKAVLPSDATLVAVKCLAENGDNFDKSFAAELVAVAHLRHRNLVRLRGWCVHDHQLLLVYDYMPNRSLDTVLFNFKREQRPSDNSSLNFERRHKIVLGLAAALFYLHEQLETQIIHRDVKTSNVMLDSHYNARLGDFGLARWLERDLESRIKTTPSMTMSMRNHDQFRLAETTRIGGTIGYLPPESFQKRYVATAKSDVFGFGVVVLEVASGRRAVDLTYPDDKIILLDWVRRLADDGRLLLAGDAHLSDGSYKLYEMEHMIHLGLLCTLHYPNSRPNMKWVLDVLCGNILGKLPSLPSFKNHPLYISLSSSGTTSSGTTGKSTTITITSSTTGTGVSASTPTIYITAAGKTIFVTAEGGGKDSHTDAAGSTESKRHQHIPVVETPREISYKEIVAATHNFSDNHRVAELDFGTAYHGFLENRHHILVKRLGMKTCPALRIRFSTELQNIGRLRHRNLVQLRGWCTEQGEMLVVYDFLASRLLSHILFHDSHSRGQPVLQWCHRYYIITSLASAILYLHEEWDEQVIHRNITSSSVVVDEDMNPRLTSFALAEFLTRNEHGHHVATDSTNSVRGIFGYMSPEYMDSGEANTAADIYSFGVVVLEIISGQMAVDFRHPEVLLVKRVRNFEATNRPLEELADSQLDGDFDYEEFVRLVNLGLACTLSNPHLRPSMTQIASILDGNSSCFMGCKEGIEEWRLRNAASLSLIRRTQALGIQ